MSPVFIAPPDSDHRVPGDDSVDEDVLIGTEDGSPFEDDALANAGEVALLRPERELAGKNVTRYPMPFVSLPRGCRLDNGRDMSGRAAYEMIAVRLAEVEIDLARSDPTTTSDLRKGIALATIELAATRCVHAFLALRCDGPARRGVLWAFARVLPDAGWNRPALTARLSQRSGDVL